MTFLCFNKKHGYTLLSIWLGCFLLLHGELVSADEKTDSLASKTALEKRKAILEKDLQSLQSWLLKAQKKESSVIQKLAIVEKNISQLNRDIKADHKQLQTIQQQINENDKQIAAMDKALLQQQASLAQLLQHQYHHSPYYKTSILFADNLQMGIERILAYFNFINQAQVEKIANFRANLEVLKSFKQQKLVYQEQQQATVNTLDARQQKLVAAKLEHKETIDKLAAERKQNQNTLRQQNDALAQIDTLLRQLEEALQYSPPPNFQGTFAEAKGKLNWPVKGEVLNNYGKPQPQYPLSEHGWLISTQPNQEVRSVFEGQVVVSDWLKGYGLIVIINHGDGYLSLYGRNQALFKNVGELVEAGEVIALSGGELKEQGVYFSIRKSGRPQDPGLWLKKIN